MITNSKIWMVILIWQRRKYKFLGLIKQSIWLTKFRNSKLITKNFSTMRLMSVMIIMWIKKTKAINQQTLWTVLLLSIITHLLLKKITINLLRKRGKFPYLKFSYLLKIITRSLSIFLSWKIFSMSTLIILEI